MGDVVKEEVYETVEVEAPSCFGFHDGLDPSCSKRCKFREECQEEQEGIKPVCFGRLSDESVGECQACILASQCVEELTAQEAKEMVKRKLKVRRRVRTPDPEPEDIAEDDENEGEDYAALRVAELREELNDRGLDNTGRKSVLVERLLEDDEGLEDEPVPEPAPKPKVRRKAQPARRKAQPARRKAQPARAKPVPEPEPEEAAVAGIAISTIDELFQGLTVGAAITITRVGDGQYLMTAGEPIVAAPVKKGKGLRGDEYWQEVLTDEYYEFMNVDCGEGKPWSDMSVDEKYEFADALEIEWEKADDDRVNNLRMVQVLFKELEIVKYKDEYKSKAARDALR